jgi:hypothetical protein
VALRCRARSAYLCGRRTGAGLGEDAPGGGQSLLSVCDAHVPTGGDESLESAGQVEHLLLEVRDELAGANMVVEQPPTVFSSRLVVGISWRERAPNTPNRRGPARPSESGLAAAPLAVLLTLLCARPYKKSA